MHKCILVDENHLIQKDLNSNQCIKDTLKKLNINGSVDIESLVEVNKEFEANSMPTMFPINITEEEFKAFSCKGFRLSPLDYYDLPEFVNICCNPKTIKTQEIDAHQNKSVTIKVTNPKLEALQNVKISIQSINDDNVFEKRTNSDGETTFLLQVDGQYNIRFEPDAREGYWNKNIKDIPLTDNLHCILKEVNTNLNDTLRSLYQSSEFSSSGEEVKIGVIDTGIAEHSDLPNDIARVNIFNELVSGNDGDPYSHGTHVAGIINTIAPKAKLFSYRIFEKGTKGACNCDVAKALIKAKEDGCDIVNLSIGIGNSDDSLEEIDPVISSALEVLFNAGIMVVVAAGNDYRDKIDVLARDHRVVGVTALGMEDKIPEDSYSDSLRHSTMPIKNEFFASFSNHGPCADYIAPGIAIISTLSNNNKYGAKNGTSMSAPIISGVIAIILSKYKSEISVHAINEKVHAIRELLNKHCTSLEFGPNFEGNGLPYPPF